MVSIFQLKSIFQYRCEIEKNISGESRLLFFFKTNKLKLQSNFQNNFSKRNIFGINVQKQLSK